MLSKKHLTQRIEKSWELIKIANTDIDEEWTFGNGIVTRVDKITNDTIDKGTYKLSTGIDNAVVEIKNFNLSRFNGKWNVLRLDDGFLVIAVNQNENGAVYEREFFAK